MRARYDEALEVAQAMVGVADGAALGEHQVLARVIAAMALSRLGRIREAVHRVGEAEQLLVSRPVGQVARGSFLVELGWLRLRLGQAEDAVRCGEEAIALLGPTEARREAMNARSLTGCAYSALGRYETAATHLAEALALARARDDRRNEAASLQNLAELARLSGDGARAVGLIGEVLVVLRQIGERDQEALALVDHATVLEGLGDTDGADRLRAEAHAVFAGLGLSRLVAAVDRRVARSPS